MLNSTAMVSSSEMLNVKYAVFSPPIHQNVISLIV
jgi:hypothetical protein